MSNTFHLLSRRVALLLGVILCLCSEATAQTLAPVKGTVVDEGGMPLMGVVVLKVGTQNATQTDEEGRFSIKAKKGDKLRFSYIGMKPQVIALQTSSLRVQMKADAALFDEVVVTGYQRVKSRAYTGAAAQVKMADIKLEGISDVSRMLEGRVAGLNIQNISGSFGAAPRINIRGGASIIGNVQPLWIIDGVVHEDLVNISMDELASGDATTLIGSAVAGLNASDIQDIQVLKDASATSVYGARALNGVIVVTTKSGRRNSPLSVQYSMETSSRLRPHYGQFDLLNSQQTLAIYQEMLDKGYFSTEQMLYGRRGGIYHQMYRQLTTIDPLTGKYYLENTPEAKLAFLQTRERANTDWFEHLFRRSIQTQQTLSMSGGGEHTATYASISYLNDPGWSIADKVRRLTTKLKNTFYISPQFEVALTLDGNLREQRMPGTLPQQRNTVIGGFERDFDINPFSYALGTSRTLSPYDEQGRRAYYRNNWADFNILNEYDNNYIDLSVLDFKAQTEGEWKWNEHLNLRGLLAIRHSTTTMAHYIKEGSNIVGAWRAADHPLVVQENIYLLRDADHPLRQPQVVLPHGGMYHRNETQLGSVLARLSADYQRTFGDHDLKLFGFAEIRSTNRESAPFQGYGIQYDKGGQVYPNPLVFQRLANSNSPYFTLTKRYDRGITFSTSATYGYQGRYVFNTVVNYEGSNASGKKSRNQWLPTANIGGKWNIDREPWFNRDMALQRFALRASYGLTAKMNEEAINAQAIYMNQLLQRPSANERENALKILHLENRDLTWEKMYETNLGAEMGFWDNRLTLALDVYQRDAFDLIDLVRTSGVGGQYYKYANFGDMRTRGIEISLQAKPIVGKAFSWDTGLTLSYMKQTITRLLNAPNTFDMVAGRGRGNIEGFPKGALFSFNFQGLNAEGLPTFDFGLYPTNADPVSQMAGADFLDTEFSKSYLIYHGPVEPVVSGGFSNTFRYKRWELGLFVTMAAGNKIRLNPTFDPTFADLNVFSKSYNERWLHPGDELFRDVPTLPSQDQIVRYGRENIERAYNTYNYSQMRVADGSFVRLKNISLGYSLTDEWCKRLRLKSMALKASLTNPFLIYADRKLNGQDPEFYQSGGVALPTPRQYTLTLHLGF